MREDKIDLCCVLYNTDKRITDKNCVVPHNKCAPTIGMQKLHIFLSIFAVLFRYRSLGVVKVTKFYCEARPWRHRRQQWMTSMFIFIDNHISTLSFIILKCL